MKTRQSASFRAGLIMPVARFNRKLHNLPQRVNRVSKGAGVYISAVVEYLIAELLELSGNCCRDNRKARITPRHIMIALAMDQELDKAFKDRIIPGAGAFSFGPTMAPAHIVKPGGGLAPTLPKAVPKKAAAAPARPAALLKKQSSQKKASTNVTTLSERALASGQKIAVVQADITNVAVDAIVHPTSNSFHLAGQVGGAIARAGGQQVKQATINAQNAHGNLALSDAAIGGAGGNLPCNHIIHVYSPSWEDENQAGSIANLTKAVENILTLCNTQGIKTVAVPSISSGGNGFPKQTAAQTILRAINSHFKSLAANKANSSLEKVYFVLFDKESVDVYTSELGKLEI